jgi:raffinose/stachyose/melibiose transport system permease protein
MGGALAPHCLSSKEKRRAMEAEKRRWAWIFLAPALLIYTIFWVFSLAAGLGLSTVKWSGYGQIVWAGIQNFVMIINYKYFSLSLFHNLEYLVLNVIVGTGLGLLSALLLDQLRRGRLFFRTAVYLPVVLSWVIVAFLVRWFLNPVYGLMQPLLNLLGLGFVKINWMGDIESLIRLIIAVGIWKTYPISMVIFFAALQEIPVELKEAAYIDGANELNVTLRIVLPLLKPVLAVVISLALIDSFRVFDPFYVLGASGGQQANPLLDVLTTLLYRRAFGQWEIGVASAIGFILFIVTMSMSVVYLQTLGRSEE